MAARRRPPHRAPPRASRPAAQPSAPRRGLEATLPKAGRGGSGVVHALPPSAIGANRIRSGAPPGEAGARRKGARRRPGAAWRHGFVCCIVATAWRQSDAVSFRTPRNAFCHAGGVASCSQGIARGGEPYVPRRAGRLGRCPCDGGARTGCCARAAGQDRGTTPRRSTLRGTAFRGVALRGIALRGIALRRVAFRGAAPRRRSGIRAIAADAAPARGDRGQRAGHARAGEARCGAVQRAVVAGLGASPCPHHGATADRGGGRAHDRRIPGPRRPGHGLPRRPSAADPERRRPRRGTLDRLTPAAARLIPAASAFDRCRGGPRMRRPAPYGAKRAKQSGGLRRPAASEGAADDGSPSSAATGIRRRGRAAAGPRRGSGRRPSRRS